MFRRSLLTAIFFMFSPRAQLSVTSPLISTSILSPNRYLDHRQPPVLQLYHRRMVLGGAAFLQRHAIRNDGTLLILTFLKEQEFVGWSHYVTNGVQFNRLSYRTN